MKYAVWGTGVRGNLAVSFIGIDNIAVFIDENRSKQHCVYMGRNVVSFDEYVDSYSGFYIVITPNDCDGIIKKLNAQGIEHYSLLKDIIY